MTAHALERAAGTAVGSASSASLPTAFVCDGCGFLLPAGAPVVPRCPAAAPGDDVDHVLRRTIDPARLAFPDGTEPNPFVRYRTLFHAYHVHRARGGSDEAYVAMVEQLDQAVAAVDGRGFGVTPLLVADELRARLGRAGPLLVKDETGNVSGSHKGRHLFGAALELAVAEDAARATAGTGTVAIAAPPPLAIASCGNAALAAAVVARAWGRELDVFVPAEAERAIVAELRRLGARVTVAAREPGVTGDPSYRLLRRAVDEGAVPFTCQGNENSLAIEGGATLGYELAADLRAVGATLDRLFVQVGGGALASSVSGALEDAVTLGVLGRMPRIHAVQSAGTQPLVRAYERAAAHLVGRLGVAWPSSFQGSPGRHAADARAALAELLRDEMRGPRAAGELAAVARHRSAYMWPWETAPGSVAGGILDDETYDWFAVVRAMLLTGGYPVAVGEATLVEANELARATTTIDVDATGSAGLAGLLELDRAGLVGPAESIAILFTGVRRSASDAVSDLPVNPRPQHGEPR